MPDYSRGDLLHTRSGFGACEGNAFTSDGEPRPSGCFTACIRGYGRSAHPEPTRYVLFRARELFAGFTSCREECLRGLYGRTKRRYPSLFENTLFVAFDLTTPAPRGPGGDAPRG